MIINCECGEKKFNVDSSLIPKEGRLLKCGSCSKIWHYTPIIETKNDEELLINNAITAAKRSTIPLAASSLKNDVKPFVIFWIIFT